MSETEKKIFGKFSKPNGVSDDQWELMIDFFLGCKKISEETSPNLLIQEDVSLEDNVVKYGSYENFLARKVDGHNLKGDEQEYYSLDQKSFGERSRLCLHNVSKIFRAEHIFEQDKSKVSVSEMLHMERLYKSLIEAREGLGSGKGQCRYVPTFDLGHAYTSLRSGDSIYDRLIQYAKETKPELELNGLNLDYVLQFLEVVDHKFLIDDVLGMMRFGKKTTGHQIGNYRKEATKNVVDMKNKSGNIFTVDYYTTLFAKRAFVLSKEMESETSKEARDKKLDESLKCVFLFGVLRGYNGRSMQGTCWAQEISMRWLLDQMGLPTFRMAPGVSLEIEACLVGDDDESAKRFSGIIQQMVEDYKDSVGIGLPKPHGWETGKKDSFFDIPLGLELSNPISRSAKSSSPVKVEDSRKLSAGCECVVM